MCVFFFLECSISKLLTGISQEPLIWPRHFYNGQYKEQDRKLWEWTCLDFGESVRAVEVRVGWRRIVETSSGVP